MAAALAGDGGGVCARKVNVKTHRKHRGGARSFAGSYGMPHAEPDYYRLSYTDDEVLWEY